MCPDDVCVLYVLLCDDSTPCEVSPFLKDIREHQLQDPESMAYIKYLEESELPTDESAAR